MAALLLPVLALAATASPAPGAARLAPASASATATVQILTPALIGADYGAPRPGMEPRTLSVLLPGGSSMPLTVYEFE